MDTSNLLDGALKDLGFEVSTQKEDKEKYTESAKRAGMDVFEGTENRSQDPQKIVYGLTQRDREIAASAEVRLVPWQYKDASFDLEKIKYNIATDYVKKKKTYIIKKFTNYIEICDSVLSIIRSGQLPRTSLLIGAPNGFGKTSFVTEALITLFKKGYMVAPYISLYELFEIKVQQEEKLMKPFYYKDEILESAEERRIRRLNYMYTEPNRYKGYIDRENMKEPRVVTGHYSFSEYINADCLFVFFSGPESKDVESQMLYQLLSIRGAKALPTIVMISTSLDQYLNDDRLKQYVWNEILTNDQKEYCYDRVCHISTYKFPRTTKVSEKKETWYDPEIGIIS